MSSPPPAERPNIIPIPIFDAKWQKALNSDYLLFFAPQAGGQRQAGIYCARIDFTQIGRKDPHKLLDQISNNMHLIEDLSPPKQLRVWDVNGNDHVLAVAYSILGAGNKTTSKLKVLTSQGGNFTKCDEVDHSVNKINTVKAIVPFKDKEDVHVVYGLSNGMDASGH